MAVRHASDSATRLTFIVLEHHLDETGHCDPSHLLYLADDAAYVAAMRHCQGEHAGTASVSDLEFSSHARFHDLVYCDARVTATGHRSMLVEVELSAWAPPFVRPRFLSKGDFVYVQLEPQTPIPKLEAASEEEVDRLEEAAKRLDRIKAPKEKSRLLRGNRDSYESNVY